MKLNNRGMTLVEMIVAFAILGIVSASIFSMMLTGTKTYTRLTNTVKVQYDTQLAVANIEKRVMNCNEAISWDSDKKTLYMLSEVEEGGELKKNLQVIYLKDGELYLGVGNLNRFNRVELRFYLLAEHVKDMDVELSPLNSVSTMYARLKFDFNRNGKELSSEKMIALRNTPSQKYTFSLDQFGNYHAAENP